MGFAEAAKARQKSAGLPCSVCAAIASAPKKLAAEIVEAMGDRSINGAAIHAEMEARGLTCSQQQVTRHRNGRCSGRAT